MDERTETVTDRMLFAARFAYASVYETGSPHKEALKAAIEAALEVR